MHIPGIHYSPSISTEISSFFSAKAFLSGAIFRFGNKQTSYQLYRRPREGHLQRQLGWSWLWLQVGGGVGQIEQDQEMIKWPCYMSWNI